uniref:Uncharacterized protein n=1 Tax=Sinocyclocheilus anshuiensis TaxID=1608454 RepID=A0A671KSM9_9TELE
SAAEGDPRRCRMSGVGGRDELELSMPFFLIIGCLSSLKRGERDHSAELLERRAEVIPQYVEQLEECVQRDMIPVSRLTLEQVEWTRTPEPIEVLVFCLRAVREKLPRGLYSLSVSLQTQLGGHTLCWSRLQEQQWVGRAEPVEHQGRYFDIELNINQSLYMVLPASCDLLPSSVLVFKLLSLPGDHSHVSSVVGWGAFPVCNCSLQLFNGKFKTPLLRGSPNPSLNQFRRIEHLLSTDLDNWLCNLYFQSDSASPFGCTNDSLSSPDYPLKSSEVRFGKSPICFFFVPRSQHHNQHRSAAVCCGTGERTRLAVRLLPSLLGLSCHPRPHLSQISLTILLFGVMWFPRLYLHYCSQWLFLQAQHIPINRFGLGAHTVDLVYQGSLLSTLEEVLLVLLGPLTLNAATLLLLLIRWGCQLAFGSPPSFLSKFIMAAAVWTVLDPLAVFAVDAVLGRLSYSAEEPLADAAKLYWHFFRTEQSGAAGIIITLFLYSVHCILSFTFLYVYFLRLHNDGRLLDIYLRLHSTEGAFFVPHDMEVSNQELNYIVKKAEQWRGFNGERRKVAVYDYIWTEEEPVVGLAPPSGTPNTGCETSTHLSIYTLHLSGLRHHYRHFLRQPDGAILEVHLLCRILN